MDWRQPTTSNNAATKSPFCFKAQARAGRASWSKKDHPAYALFTAVKDKVAGASCGCADVFGAQEGIAACGLELIKDNAIPHTSGLPSLARLTAEGYSVLTF